MLLKKRYRVAARYESLFFKAFKKDSLEYNREKQKRVEKNKSKKLPISQFDSLIQKLENEILKQKILEKNKQQTA